MLLHMVLPYIIVGLVVKVSFINNFWIVVPQIGDQLAKYPEYMNKNSFQMLIYVEKRRALKIGVSFHFQG